MKKTSLVGAVGIVLLANTLALMHAARNRSGQAEAEVVLTDRELSYWRDADNSGVSLNLRILTWWWWSDTEDLKAFDWLDKTKLEELGFDCSVAPSDQKAGWFYSRQIPRTAFVALEYDGAAWQAALERLRKRAARNPEEKDTSEDQSHLVAIDAARDPTTLRGRHPDRNRVLVVPAVIAISFTAGAPATDQLPARSPRLSGRVREIPDEIHVPRPFSDGFRALSETSHDEMLPGRRRALYPGIEARYRVHLRYGSLLEPWVSAVEFLPR